MPSLYVPERARVVRRLKGLAEEDWLRTAEHEEYSHFSVFLMFSHLLIHEMLQACKIEELMLREDWA